MLRILPSRLLWHLALGLVAAIPPGSAAAGRGLAFTEVSGPSSFDLFVQRDGRRTWVSRIPVQGSTHERTVEARLSPGGQRVAVIPSFDTLAGTGLWVFDLGAGTWKALEEGRIASVVWSPDGSALAYAL